MKKVVFIALMLMSFLVIRQNKAFALDTWENKLHGVQTVNIKQLDRDLDITYELEQEYDFDANKFTEYTYGIAFDMDVTKHTGVTLQYTYTDSRVEDDREELEGDYTIFYNSLPFKIDLQDINKLIGNIRNGNGEYQNEIDLSHRLFMIADKCGVDLLLKNEAHYDFQENTWSQNNFGSGLNLDFGDWGSFSVVYWNLDDLEGSENGSELETQLQINF